MSPSRRRVVVAGAVAFAAAWVFFAIYSKVDDDHPVPRSVPAGAVEIPMIAKSHGWAMCSIEGSQARCRVFNQKGETITLMTSSCRLMAGSLPARPN